MTLVAVYNNESDIPETLKQEYKEKDGKWYLDLDDSIRIHTTIAPLQNTLTTLKAEKATLSSKVNTLTAKIQGLPDDFDPAKYQDIVTELEALKKDPNRDKNTEEKLQQAREQYEQRIRNIEASSVTKLAEKDAEIAKRDGVITKLVVDDGLTKSLVDVGVGKEFLKASGAMLKSSVKVVVNEDTGEYSPVVETDLGEVPLTQFVENWSKSDEGKPFIKNPAGGGAGGSGDKSKGNEINPWKAESRNLTEQGKILKEDRVKAERLMKAAGIPAHTINQTLGRATA